METVSKKMLQGLHAGVLKGWGGFVWMLKIIVPISFVTMLIDYSGWLNAIDGILAPVLGLLKLPAMAALPLLAGVLAGLFAAIAAMAALPFTDYEMTLMAIFLLISHNLIQEGIIQGKSGINPVKATVFRLVASVIMVWLAGLVIVPETAGALGREMTPLVQGPFLTVFKSWSMETALLCAKVFVLIMAIMIILETVKRFDLLGHVLKWLNPALRFMGIPRRLGFMWLAAALFGIVFGGAVIVEEAKAEDLDRDELERLHLSIGINHALIEDPGMFLALGLSPFWLWVPRIAGAIVAVNLLKAWQRIKRRTHRRPF